MPSCLLWGTGNMGRHFRQTFPQSADSYMFFWLRRYLLQDLFVKLLIFAKPQTHSAKQLHSFYFRTLYSPYYANKHWMLPRGEYHTEDFWKVVNQRTPFKTFLDNIHAHILKNIPCINTHLFPTLPVHTRPGGRYEESQENSSLRPLLCGASFLDLGTKAIVNKEINGLPIEFDLVSL